MYTKLLQWLRILTSSQVATKRFNQFKDHSGFVLFYDNSTSDSSFISHKCQKLTARRGLFEHIILHVYLICGEFNVWTDLVEKVDRATWAQASMSVIRTTTSPFEWWNLWAAANEEGNLALSWFKFWRTASAHKWRLSLESFLWRCCISDVSTKVLQSLCITAHTSATGNRRHSCIEYILCSRFSATPLQPM